MLTQTRATYTGTKEYETDRMDAWACWANAIPGISGGILLRIRGICGNSRNFSRCLYQDFSERDLREIGRLLFTNEATADRFADRILEARKKDPEEEAFNSAPEVSMRSAMTIRPIRTGFA